MGFLQFCWSRIDRHGRYHASKQRCQPTRWRRNRVSRNVDTQPREANGGDMGLVDRFERKLENTVGDAFARVFGGSIVPQEVESLLRREADSGAREIPGRRIFGPRTTTSLPSVCLITAR